MQKSIKMKFGETCTLLSFGLKCHSGHKKLISQKAYLEVHTTVSKDSRAKKRFAVLRMTKHLQLVQ